MSDEKNKVTDKAGEIAKNIWLAGVGAYGKAVEDAQGRLEKAMEPPKLFRDLVKAGAALEEDARDALESTAAARHSVEERIHRVRENFHMQRPARIEDLARLNKKVDQLTRKVDKLSKALTEQGLIKPVPGKSKSPTRKAAAASKGRSGTSTSTKSTAQKKKTAATGSKANPRKKASTRSRSATTKK